MFVKAVTGAELLDIFTSLKDSSTGYDDIKGYCALTFNDKTQVTSAYIIFDKFIKSGFY